MRALSIRGRKDDRGSIILALLGIVILTTVASVGLSAVVTGQHQSRHDDAFTQSLNNAESGIDAMVATIKSTPALNSPSQALSQSPHLTTLNYTLSGYNVTATPVNNIGATGNASSTTWTIQATGTSTEQGHTVTRIVNETVNIAHTYNTPIEGKNGLNLPAGSKVSNYQTQPAADGTPATTLSPITTQGPTVSLLNIPLVTLGSMTITNVPSGGSPGAAQTGGPLNMSASDLSQFAQIAIDQGGSCAAGTTVCNSTEVVNQTAPAPPIATPGCAGNEVGAELNGLNIGVPLGGLVLNTNLTATLIPPAVTGDTFCTNLPIVIPTVGTNLNTLSSQLGLSALSGLVGLSGSVDVPIGSTCTDLNTTHIITNLLTYVDTDNLSCAMNPPSQLVFNEVGTGTVFLGTGGSVPTYVSAEINSPNGNCDISGNVILWGTIACNTITYEPGSSLTVYYPTDEGLTGADTQHQDVVSNWNECEVVNKSASTCS